MLSDVARLWKAKMPDLKISIIAPSVGADDFIEIVGMENVHRVEETPREVTRLVARPWELVALFVARIRPIIDILDRLRPDVVYTTGDFFVNHAAASTYRRAHPNSFWLGSVFHINPPPLRRHNAFLPSFASYLLQRLSLRWLRHMGDLIYVLNTDVQRQLYQLGFDQRRIVVMGGAIRFDEFPIGDPPLAGYRILWLNRLHPTKGLDDLPEIWTLLPPDVTIDVVGVSAYTERLVEAAKRYGVIDRFRIHGFVSKARRWELMQQANLFISCSYEEGWGISICEALAMGLPVVAYDLPALREVFGQYIHTVPTGNKQALASAILDVLQQPLDEAARVARRNFAAQFDASHLALRQAKTLITGLKERNRVTIVGIGDVAPPNDSQRVPSTTRRLFEEQIPHAVIAGPLSASLVHKISPGAKIVALGTSRTLTRKRQILLEYTRRLLRLSTIPLPPSEVIFAVSGEVIDVLAAVIVARRSRARLLIALDEEVQHRAGPRRKAYEWLVRGVAKQLYRFSDMILTKDINAYSKLERLGLPLRPVVRYEDEYETLSDFLRSFPGNSH